MRIGALILVDPAQPGNLGAAMRVAANFGVRRLELVRPAVDPRDPEVERWACGGQRRIEWRAWTSLEEAATSYHTLAASASGRGRQNLPMISPREVAPLLIERGLPGVALVFGNETRGLRREELDQCDLVVSIPTEEGFPVLNLTQSVAILVASITMSVDSGTRPREAPAVQAEVEKLMAHLRQSLLTIGFLDPLSPQRILRKLRRLFGRAGITENEVVILRGICRQMEWAAGHRAERFQAPDEP